MRVLATCGILLAATPSGGEAPRAARGSARVESVTGSVVAGGRPLFAGTSVGPRSAVDASEGTVTLEWELQGTRVHASGVELHFFGADAEGVRLSVGEIRLSVRGAQTLSISLVGGRVLLEAAPENTGDVVAAICQTNVLLPKGAAASIVPLATEPAVRVHAERGAPSVSLREAGARAVEAPAVIEDACVAFPGTGLDSPETRPPLTPFEP